jgi:hypothetical protein
VVTPAPRRCGEIGEGLEPLRGDQAELAHRRGSGIADDDQGVDRIRAEKIGAAHFDITGDERHDGAVECDSQQVHSAAFESVYQGSVPGND